MYKLLGLVLVIFAAFASAQDSPKLQIGVYYEHLCRDSYNFITNQLSPAFEYIADSVDILYVPFGKAWSVNGGESFVCQHGPAECEGNKIQSCALHLLNGNQRLQTEFVTCQMHADSDKTGQYCSTQVGLNFADVLECFDSDLGTQLQLEAEVLTNNVQNPLVFVPTIVYNNGEFNQELQDRSLMYFFYVVCELLYSLNPDTLPADCPVPY